MNLGAAKSVFLGAHGTASTKFVFRNMVGKVHFISACNNFDSSIQDTGEVIAHFN